MPFPLQFHEPDVMATAVTSHMERDTTKRLLATMARRFFLAMVREPETVPGKGDHPAGRSSLRRRRAHGVDDLITPVWMSANERS